MNAVQNLQFVPKPTFGVARSVQGSSSVHVRCLVNEVYYQPWSTTQSSRVPLLLARALWSTGLLLKFQCCYRSIMCLLMQSSTTLSLISFPKKSIVLIRWSCQLDLKLIGKYSVWNCIFMCSLFTEINYKILLATNGLRTITELITECGWKSAEALLCTLCCGPFL